jgi:hypothetical protein
VVGAAGFADFFDDLDAANAGDSDTASSSASIANVYLRIMVHPVKEAARPSSRTQSQMSVGDAWNLAPATVACRPWPSKNS